ncbi:hypothetical protein L1049_017455 [Liquidambar formosana]|uniref:TFIIB-type domain-containing protein n=1 Tax=Liquidambar formosana TaxID=63359 RepID=A0AAP0X199_LIQFO
MESSRSCKSCKRKSLVRDDVSGSLVCSSCGIVQDFDNFEAQIGGISGPQGTFVRVGTAGSGSIYNYKEKKIFEAQRLIDELMFKLGFSASKSNEVRTMISKITEGEFGQGNWFPILIGACAYVAMRNDNRPLPIAEVAAVIGCDVNELGRMIHKVVEFLDLKLPELDVVSLFERAVRTCSSFTRVSKEKAERMRKQGIFVMQCAVKWFLTTGRRPPPVVAAVLVFVAKLNQIDVRIEDVAKEVNAGVATSKLRYKELLEMLVRVAQVLPWGKDITVKNILKNAPFVIQYMEMKSRLKPGENKSKDLQCFGFDLDYVLSECLRKEVEYGTESYSVENDSQYFEVEDKSGFQTVSVDDLEKLKVSQECLSMIYSNFLNDVGYVKSIGESGEDRGRKRRRGYEFHACKDWWDGKSEMSKKLLFKQILEKDVGLDAMPPSFVTGCLAHKKRREKINAAKLRIDKIMRPSNIGSGDTVDFCFTECIHAGKKRWKKQFDGIDWEDFIIETLLLHQVKEEEIEKGHYNALLSLHVFNSGNM